MAAATQGNLQRSYYFAPFRVRLVIITSGRDIISRDSNALLTQSSLKCGILTLSLVLL